MKSLFTAAAVAGVLAFSMATAQAATYDLTGGSGSAASYVFSSAGSPDLTVSAMRESGSAVVASDGATVTRNSNGLGAQYSGDSDPSQVDTSGRDEVLVLDFGSAVQLISVTFANFSGNDDFQLWFDSGNDGTMGSSDYEGSAGSSPYVFSGTYIGTLFGIGATGSSDEWRLASVEANAISAVPVPAALPLFGAALLGMGFLARRRKQKAAKQA